jgi:Protein involved in initiation of plasmid replication
VESKYLVTKSNKLITANYDLSVQEQKVILTLASMVQPQDVEFKEYEFKIKDFIELLGIKDDKKYKEVPKITKNLMKKIFEIKEGKDIIQMAWLSSVRYKTGEGIVILKFDSNLKPYMLELKELYTSYKLENILSLKSKYSIRLYEVLKSNLFKNQVTIELEELKRMLGAKEKSYNVYQNFKNKAIEKALTELKQKTDIAFTYTEIKTGRKVTSLKFSIKSNSPIKENPEALEEISATKTEKTEEDPKDEEKKELIKQVKNIIEEEISSLEATKLLLAANSDLEIIKKKYAILKQTNGIKNIVAWLIKAIKDDYSAPISGTNNTNNSFTNRKQANYNIKDLERKLLGWDNIQEEQEEEYEDITIEEILASRKEVQDN